MKSAYTAATIVFIIGVGWLSWITWSLIFPVEGQAVAATPTVEFTVIGGEAKAKFAFALEGQELTSPGPQIKVKTGDIVKVTFKNIGETAHGFTVTTEKKETAPVLFRATVGTGARPMVPKAGGSVVFAPDKPGDYFYICPVPGHALLGMWGEFKVEG